MAFTPAQLRKIHVVRRRIAGLRDEGTWRFLLRMTGCRRDPQTGEPSLAHERNGHDEYETIMLRLASHPDSQLDEDEWLRKVNQKDGRLRHALLDFERRCVAAEICSSEALPSLCERMTARRPEYLDQPPTRNVRDLDFSELLHVVEGFKAWMRREASKRGVQAPKFGGAA
ncbi:MAG: hypothetical protein IT430_18905 [Phycisphaerales bacterium]|nr:hypothetical protein [Phycisphaerales bacterium]